MENILTTSALLNPYDVSAQSDPNSDACFVCIKLLFVCCLADEERLYLALRSIRRTLFIFGLASGTTLTQPRATFKTASIWFRTASDVLLMLKSRMRSHLSRCAVLFNTHLASSVPSLTGGFPVSNSSRMTPKL